MAGRRSNRLFQLITCSCLFWSAVLVTCVRAATIAPLRDLQVYPPVLTPTSTGVDLVDGSSTDFQTSIDAKKQGCVVTQTLMVHEFANSYGNPFVGQYTPPACAFNRIVWNFTVTSAGRQFDRLGVVYFGNTELWRTSTAEPTKTGIVWTYIKDMSNYLALFKEKQKLIFDLGNLVDSTYTGPYDATLTATFFTSEDTVDPADRIIPISARNGPNNMGSTFSFPSQNATNTVSLPRNINRAVFTMSATGQIDEEFWFGNVLSSDVNTFGPGVLLPFSPFREVQLYIDGTLAGVAWPFPIIFTGGVVPGLWRPIVGIDAFDLRENEIDITPFLPMLCDGKKHTFTMVVSGLNDNGKGKATLAETTGSYWLLTGKIFLWLDPAGSITTGSGFRNQSPAPTLQISSSVGKDKTGANMTLTNIVSASRQLSISSVVKSASGSKRVSWSQDLAYSNQDFITDYGNTQYFVQSTNGTDVSSAGYAREYSYPITLNTTFFEGAGSNGNLSIDAVIFRGQTISTIGQAVFPTGLQSFNPLSGKQDSYPQYQGSILTTTQNGTGHYLSVPATMTSYSSGSTQQDMVFTGLEIDQSSYSSGYPQASGSGELYQRHVLAVNGTLVSDQESLIGRPFSTRAQPQAASVQDQTFAGGSVKQFLGRGPGSSTDGA